MSYNSPPPFIKPDPDGLYYDMPPSGVQSGYMNAGNNQAANPELMTREVLTRGFSSFDDANISSSMIPESDLLDFEALGNTDMNYPSGTGDSGTNGRIDMKMGAENGQNMGSMGGQDMNLGMGSYFSPSSRNVKMTSPVPGSSPFDEFMMQQQQQRNIGQKIMSGNNSAQQAVRVPRPGSHTQRFLYDNDYIPKHQSNLQSMSVPESSSWNTPPGSFDQGYTSPPSTSARPLGSSLPGGDTDKQQLLMMEKRRRRRESHNAVERRRRDIINEKIQELASLIPEHLLLGAATSTNTSASTGNAAGVNSGSVGTDASTPGGFSSTPVSSAVAAAAGKDGKPNKGIILRKSVDYIRQLQTILEEQKRRNVELELRVQSLEKQQGITRNMESGPSSISQQSGESNSGLGISSSSDSGNGINTVTSTSNHNTGNNMSTISEYGEDFEYDDNVFRASPHPISDNDLDFGGMEIN
ncbi:helix-loop-helix DNA-binding domain-containing protein [Dipodascopsis uninucleata]